MVPPRVGVGWAVMLARAAWVDGRGAAGSVCPAGTEEDRGVQAWDLEGALIG